MKLIVQSAFVALLFFTATPLALADNSGSTPATPPSSNPGDQFKAAGENIGSAAKQIGEGVKEGAVRTWEAVKEGANAAGQKLSGSGSGASPRSSDSEKEPAR